MRSKGSGQANLWWDISAAIEGRQLAYDSFKEGSPHDLSEDAVIQSRTIRAACLHRKELRTGGYPKGPKFGIHQNERARLRQERASTVVVQMDSSRAK